MTTAALANGNHDGAASGESNSTGNAASPSHSLHPNPQALKKAANVARGLADDASKAIGNLLPTASLQNITTRKYTLPDKTVASQVLMYRQLLHTSCRPGLKLSRQYQATAAQKAVIHMPWWEQGIEETHKMVITYDNLITRLWLNGAITPFQKEVQNEAAPDLLDSNADTASQKSVETYITDAGIPPIPHEFWVDRLGFQQPDPVTDFRSGGVLSLAMLVYMVESCPKVCERFFSGDASVLPFGITCINVTDMMAKFLMLAKSTDRMDALLSQKPFWRMFADPNAILALQELSMTMLCDVVVELGKERQMPNLNSDNPNDIHGERDGKVTVFDFSTILERTERRVRDDLLGAGPKTVEELRSIAGRLRVKYSQQLERKIQRAEQRRRSAESNAGGPVGVAGVAQQVKVAEVMAQAGSMAGGLFAKIKPPTFPMMPRKEEKTQPSASAEEPAPTIVSIPPANNSAATDTATTTTPTNVEGDWAGTDIAPVTDAISNFSIGDEDDDDDL